MRTLLLASMLALLPFAGLAQSDGSPKLDGLARAKKADKGPGAKLDGLSRAKKARAKAAAAHKKDRGIIGPSDSQASRALK